MAACGHCGACCAHCGSICGASFGGSPGLLAGGFGGGLGLGSGMLGSGLGLGYMPYVGGVGFFHHKRREDHDDADGTPVECDALADPNHPGHREAVTAVAHVDDDTHESILQRIKEALAKI
jgi:hypothetical protein